MSRLLRRRPALFLHLRHRSPFQRRHHHRRLRRRLRRQALRRQAPTRRAPSRRVRRRPAQCHHLHSCNRARCHRSCRRRRRLLLLLRFLCRCHRRPRRRLHCSRRCPVLCLQACCRLGLQARRFQARHRPARHRHRRCQRHCRRLCLLLRRHRRDYSLAATRWRRPSSASAAWRLTQTDPKARRLRRCMWRRSQHGRRWGCWRGCVSAFRSSAARLPRLDGGCICAAAGAPQTMLQKQRSRLVAAQPPRQFCGGAHAP